MRQALIDYGITALARGRVTEKFAVTLGRLAIDQKAIATVASVYVLGGSSSGAAPDVAATDSDSIAASGAAGSRAAGAGFAGGGAKVAAAGAGTSAAHASGPAHQGLWITALVLGALLVIGGVTLAAWRGSGTGAATGAAATGGRRRRSARPRPGHLYSPASGRRGPGGYAPQPGGYAPQSGRYAPQSGSYAPQPGGYVPRSGYYAPKPSSHASAAAALSHPGRAARRAAQASTDAGIRTGAHQASRPVR